ncbi:MAG: gluconokinase [Microcoleaceae cyanobacterium]
MIVLIIGVSGSGKSTVGKLLASQLDYEFFDGDDFHSSENREKMQQNISLTDADRLPWLEKLQTEIRVWLQENRNVVLACSALKQNYREILLQDPEHMRLVYLQGSFEVIKHRLEQRTNHFMKVDLLQSQFDTLEEPTNAIRVNINQPLEKIVQQIQNSLSGSTAILNQS